jgi:CHASE1-domain containing sensor protein/acetyl esterase/lipase
MPTDPRPRSVALIALASGLAATLIAWIATGHQADREAQAEFASKATVATNVLERRIQRYIDAVWGLGALAYHDPNLNRAEFRRFVTALDFPHRLQGMQAVELIRRVTAAERDAFVSRVRADRSLSPQGNPEFDIRPAGARDEYWVVDFVEPESGNNSVFGLDIRTRVAAMSAAERARDTGEASATGRYRLAQELGASYGLVFYMPVYAAATPQTVAERRDALRGFVNVVVRVDDMLADMLAQPIMQGFGMRIHDRGAVDAPTPAGLESTVFYETPGHWQPNEAYISTTWRREHQRDVVVAGRRWQVNFISEPGVNPWLSRLPLLVLGAGLAMTFLLYGMLRTAARARTEAVATADRATLQLRTQLSFTQQLVEAIPNPVFFNAKGLAVAQHEATSKDGTKIPYFVVMREDAKRDGNTPTLLYGYGGFEIPMTPSYSGTIGAGWLEWGGAFVLANLRGGGEFGPEWHKAAQREGHQRSFDDFIAVAEDLVKRGITTPRHLGIMGGSNGGLLVGATFVQRPDLFRAVVCQVPLLDMKRYSHLLAGASWMGEYGDPDKPEDWAFISKYSPYQNVRKDAKYPRVLFTTTTRDDRVHPGHARKMVAKMKAQGHDVLYFEDVEGGHGAGSTPAQQAYMWSLTYTFLRNELR